MQAAKRERASEGRPLIWFVDEKPVATFLAKRFRGEDYHIFVDYLPMREGDR